MYYTTRLASFLVASAFVASAMTACSGARPQLSVIGMTAAKNHAADAPNTRTILIFVEVLNPTSAPLELERIEYRFSAESWFQADGAIALSRQLGAQGAAVIELPVRVAADAVASAEDIPYALDGTLYATSDRSKRQWQVRARGSLDANAIARAQRNNGAIEIRIASDDDRRN